METINNTVESVKKTIWGENGQSGNTTIGSGSHSEAHKSMIDDSVTETKYSGSVEKDPMAPGSYDPDKRQTEKRAEGSNVTGQNEGTNKESMSNANEPNTGFGGGNAQPSVDSDPSSGQQDTPKQQGADRPNEEPNNDNNSGSGGGNSSGGGGQGGGMKLPDDNKESESEGTGEKYEKTSGLHADGGDFDATRPGAAREADRLMEEKGIKHGDQNPDGDSGQPDKKEKKWFGVDHSGFGGHGSHQNRKSSKAKGDEDSNDTVNTSTDGANDHVDNVDNADAGDTGEKRGLAQKIKAKLHV